MAPRKSSAAGIGAGSLWLVGWFEGPKANSGSKLPSIRNGPIKMRSMNTLSDDATTASMIGWGGRRLQGCITLYVKEPAVLRVASKFKLHWDSQERRQEVSGRRAPGTTSGATKHTCCTTPWERQQQTSAGPSGGRCVYAFRIPGGTRLHAPRRSFGQLISARMLAPGVGGLPRPRQPEGGSRQGAPVDWII
ncbi:hypothetical protein B0H17DRAFT_1130704 [Mycena rosella]|uniref:Uncharacterized protein n=1 Tax=Mycena rosella TaxID=1033263 RepID=A0AAD7GNY1_MYCRO|nr:hypothetical protein B0H17DRAFT_1130704 [Mycena rosella]